jgi:hypothetical protein
MLRWRPSNADGEGRVTDIWPLIFGTLEPVA